MKFIHLLLPMLIVFFTSSAIADSAAVVSPLEMLSNCISLQSHIQLVQLKKTEGVSLSQALSFRQPPADPSLRPDQPTRIMASIKELIILVYAEFETSPEQTSKDLVAACRAYAPEQYSEQNIRDLLACNAGMPPVDELLSMKQRGYSRDRQSKIIDREMEKTQFKSDEVKAFAIENFSKAVDLVYSNPELTGREIFTKLLDTCFDESKTPPGIPQLPGLKN